MCLLTNQLKPHIAKKDITVYKTLAKTYSDVLCKHIYISPYKNMEYVPGVLYKTRIKITKLINDVSPAISFDHRTLNSYYMHVCSIGENPLIATKLLLKCNRTRSIDTGFHATTSPERFKNGLEKQHENIYLFIIPKDAQYYKDNTGLIVSNEIMMQKPATIYNLTI